MGRGQDGCSGSSGEGQKEVGSRGGVKLEGEACDRERCAR